MNARELAALQIIDVHISIEDGYHEADSTANSFREAAEMATREARRQAQPLILEALTLVRVAVREELLVTVEKTDRRHGGKIPTPPIEVTPPGVASLPASHAYDLIAE